MLNKEKQLNIVKSNEGFSLIETIVSLLILAIIIVPLLNMFVFNAQTNRRAAERQQATGLATNIVEEIKDMGVKKWATGKGWDLSAETLGFEDSKGGFDFEVEVTCQPVKHASSGGILWNKYRMADLSKLNKKTTAVVDPFEVFVTYETIGGKETPRLIDTYDDMAATEFLNTHVEEIYSHWSDYVAGIEEDEEVPPAPVAYSLTDIKQKIARETVIIVSDDPEKSGEEKQVSVAMRYKLKCDVKYHYGTNLDELPYNKPWSQETHEREYRGFYDNTKFDSLQDIYLFHTPLMGGTGAWRGDTILMQDNSGGAATTGKLFIAPQIYDLAMDIPCEVEITPATKWEVYYLSDNASYESKNKYLINGAGRVPAYDMTNVAIVTKENRLTEELPAENRLYEIVVSVSRKGSDNELIKIEMEGK